MNQNGSYSIGYDDGYVFGGHEIDVDANAKGVFVCAEVQSMQMLKKDPSKAKLLVEAMKKDNPYLVTDLGRKKSYLV